MGQADILDQRAALQRDAARALDLQVLDQGDAVAIAEARAVAVLHHDVVVVRVTHGVHPYRVLGCS